MLFLTLTATIDFQKTLALVLSSWHDYYLLNHL